MAKGGRRVVESPHGLCPCGDGRSYGDCCGPFHRGSSSVTTAEELMRSRYSAFSLGLVGYLVETLSPERRHPGDRADLERSMGATEWTGLRILAIRAGGMGDDQGEVEFVAAYRQHGLPGKLHERSHFVRKGGRWFYDSGEVEGLAPVSEPGRNMPCWCGSGKKYKKCHG